ncbi:MAG: hypothetical protein ACO1TE_06530 [Prosthecobacter sp.]
MMRGLLLVCMLFCASLQAQNTYVPRSEAKKPLSDAVEKALAEFIERCAVEKKKQLTTHMEEVTKALDEAVKLTAEEREALKPETAKAVDAATEAWKPQGRLAIRGYLPRTSDTAAKRLLNQYKPSQPGNNEPVENWTPPQEDPMWLGALDKTLGYKRLKRWEEAYAQTRKKTEKEVNDFLERWTRESRGPMNEDVEAKIALMKTKLDLPDEKIEALKKAGNYLLDQISAAERKRALEMLRPMPDEARRNIMGRSYFYVRFDRPRGEVWEKMWRDTAAEVLSGEVVNQWENVAKEEQNKQETELVEIIKPSEAYLRQQMEMAMMLEIDNLVADLGLDGERQKRLKKLSDDAVEESLKTARKQWMQQARNLSAQERQRMRGNSYFGLSEEMHAAALPVWKEGLKKLLLEKELSQMSLEKEQRQKRALTAIARACLAEMDQTLMLNDTQRAGLEPLLEKTMEPLLEQRRQEYWSYSPQQLFQHAGKVREESLRPLLDEMQRKRWQELITSSETTTRNVAVPGGTQPEVPDMEAAISAHLYKMFTVERKRNLAAMLPKVEEAQRVLSLPEETVARLTTAAKGAVEESLDQWRLNTERYVRQTVQTATPKNILQALNGTERVSFGRPTDGGPEANEIWQAALRDLLDAGQREKLKTVIQARSAYRLKAMAGMSVGEFDRRRRLTNDQCARLEPLLKKVLTEYQPDIERYMSPNWHLQYYYAMVPVAGIAEKEMQAILTPQQWKLCKERDLPDAMQYWEGIENNHKNRLKNGAKGNGVIFNGGMIIDE